MALTLDIKARTPANSLLMAVRAAIPTAREEPRTLEAAHTLSGEHVWIRIGARQGTISTPSGELAFDSYCHIRLDKFARTEATAEALRCVQSILDHTEADLVLVQLSDIPLLTRRDGVARAFRYRNEGSFWDFHALPRTGESPIPLVTIDRPIEDEDEDEDDGVAP